MTTYNYKPGLGNAASFQVSGTPFVTGNVDCTTATKISFPGVTQWVLVVNNEQGTRALVGFSEAGVNGDNYFTVAKGGTNAPGLSAAGSPLPLKVTELWILGPNDVDVLAGLSSIDVNAINNTAISPSGANWSGSLAALVG